VLKLTSRQEALQRVGLALADPNRCNLLVALLEGPAYSGELAERAGLSRSNTSNHLTCLRGCGLVVASAEGRQIRYEIADEHLASAMRDLLDVVLAVECEDDD
jgi:DNA-binding transcriptional ArsR family regulator